MAPGAWSPCVPRRRPPASARKADPRGRPRKVLTPPYAELPLDPQGAPTGSADETPEAGKATPLAFDFEALDRLIAATDEQTRHVRRLLARLAAGEPPYSEPKSSEPSIGED